MRRRWRRVAGSGGVELAIERTAWGSDPRPLVLAAHATGFCKEVYRPVVADLAGMVPSGDVLAFDHRAHGDSAVPPLPFDWWDLGRDVLAIAGAARGVVGVGHSAGAASLLLAELLAPGTFRALVLVEPIVSPGPYARMENPLVEAALKRRTAFDSRSAALDNFAGKPAFSGWQRRALEAYVHGGLAPDAKQWRLKCPPQAEAEMYRGATAHGGWERLGEIGSDITLIAGEHSDTHPGEFLQRTADQLGGGHVVVVPGTSHFVPMEQPELIAMYLARYLVPESVQRHRSR